MTIPLPTSPNGDATPLARGKASITFAHELRLALANVIGDAESARAELPPGDPAQARLARIHQAARHAQKMLADSGLGGETVGGQFAPRSIHHRHIVVVDDEIAVGLFTARLLRQIGYDASVFQSASEALSFLTSTPGDVDLIITDLCMPLLSGAELIERARALRPDLPIIVATGFPNTLEADYPIVMTTCQVLHKPFDSETLAHTVRGLLSGAKRQAFLTPQTNLPDPDGTSPVPGAGQLQRPPQSGRKAQGSGFPILPLSPA